jgi:hypothetical protein
MWSFSKWHKCSPWGQACCLSFDKEESTESLCEQGKMNNETRI